MKLEWSSKSGDEVFWLFMQVIIEVAINLLLCLWATLIVLGTFLSILHGSKENRFVYLILNDHNILDIYIYIYTYIHSTIMPLRSPMLLNMLRIGWQILLASHFQGDY